MLDLNDTFNYLDREILSNPEINKLPSRLYNHAKLTFIQSSLDRLEDLGRITLEREYVKELTVVLTDFESGLSLDHPDFGKTELQFPRISIGRYWSEATRWEVEQEIGRRVLWYAYVNYDVTRLDHPLKVQWFRDKWLIMRLNPNEVIDVQTAFRCAGTDEGIEHLSNP